MKAMLPMHLSFGKHKRVSETVSRQDRVISLQKQVRAYSYVQKLS